MSARSSTNAARILVAMIGLSIFEPVRGAVSVAVAGRSGHWQREPGAQASISPNQITEKRLLKTHGIPDVEVFCAISWSRRVLVCRDALAGCFAQRQRDLGLRNTDGKACSAFQTDPQDGGKLTSRGTKFQANRYKLPGKAGAVKPAP
jgi:hypothetical protein